MTSLGGPAHDARRLARGTFLVVGAGGLGTPLALSLLGAGVGRVVVCDPDVVDLSNLQRQVLYRAADVGRPKVLALREALLRRGIAPARIEAVRTRFDETTARALAHDADVLLDGSDDAGTKFLVNDVAVALGRPAVVAGVLRHEGQVVPVRPGRDACYRCLFEGPPEDAPSCADAGVLGPICAETAALQARAALALAGGRRHKDDGDDGELLGRVHLLSDRGVRTLSPRPRPGCPCGAAGAQPTAR